MILRKRMAFKSSGFGGGFVSKGNGLPISPLNPSGRSDLVAWYKADSLVLSNGSTVTSWPDDSPNNNDLNSYESAPIYNSSDAILGGMPSVTYDGNDSNYRSNPTGLPVGSSACTTYVVGYWSGASSTADMFTWGSNAYTGARMGAGYYSGMIFENGGIGTLARSVWANQPFIFSYPYVAGANVTDAVSYLNGVSAAGSNMGQSGVPNISNPVAEIAIGRPATAPAERWTGAVAEVLVFNTTHDAVTRESIEKYLSNKYGISTVSSAIRPSGFKAKILTAAPPAPPIVTSDLILYLDAGNPVSYPGSGTTWYDLSGNNNNAVASGTPTYTATNGGGFNFNNDADYFDTTPNLREAYTSTGLSVASWVKADALPYVSTIITRSDWNGSEGWAQWKHFGDKFMGPRYNQTASSTSLTTGVVYYLAFTIDTSGNAKTYINGIQDGSTATGVTVPTSSGVSPIIGVFSGYPGWAGDIYQIHIYNRDLSSAEILSNFNATKSRYGL